MTLLHVLTQHISADGAIRQSGDTYEESNSEYAAQRLELGIVELAKGKKSKAEKTEDKQVENPEPGASTNLIEE